MSASGRLADVPTCQVALLLYCIFVSVSDALQAASVIRAEAEPVVLKLHSLMPRCSMNAENEMTVGHLGRPGRISALANDAKLSFVVALPVFMDQLCHTASYSGWATSAIGRKPLDRFQSISLKSRHKAGYAQA